jgi:hypothetical protein
MRLSICTNVHQRRRKYAAVSRRVGHLGSEVPIAGEAKNLAKELAGLI